MVDNYRELVILQRSFALADNIKDLIARFPASERYDLAQEVQQHMTDITTNIAQSYDQKDRKIAGQFIGMAQRATKQLESQLLIAHARGYIPLEDMNALQAKLAEVAKMLPPILRQLLIPPH